MLVTGALIKPAGSDSPSGPLKRPDIGDYAVPLDGLTRKDWLAFVKVHVNGNPQTVTPNFRLGVFEMTVRRLCDLGVLANPRLTQNYGWQVWDADWRNPKSLGEFLNDPLGQYELFAESIRQYAFNRVLRDFIGTDIDGQRMTLSGALSVAHRAGLPGLCSWVEHTKDRQRFSANTTSYFLKGNTLF